MIASFRNHYDGKLNKCFILVTINFFPHNKKDPPSKEILLYDINENREYGSLYAVGFPGEVEVQPFNCHVLDRGCRSEAEWKSLIAPYMGD